MLVSPIDERALVVEIAQLFEAVEKVAASLRFPLDGEDAVRMITWSAADTIPSIDHASISLTTKTGEIQTLAPTDAIAARADELQYELHQGPCLDAAIEEPIVQVNDLRDDPRWPVFGPKAADLGLRAQVAFQFRADPNVRGALNLYANQPRSIGQDDRLLGLMFANLTAVALGWTRHATSPAIALDPREEIGRAVGIVMDRYQVDPERAFAFLVQVSQSENIKLREVAARLVADTAPEPN